MKALNELLIRQHLAAKHYNEPIHFHLFNEIGSTNQFLKELPANSALNICCAEMQTQGRGRFGRRWHSPFGENIYFSGRWELNCPLSDLSGLSLVVGLAILTCLHESTTQPGLSIKWPNDILWGSKKLCGILIELLAETNTSPKLIIGIGINVNTATLEQDLVDIPWCSLYDLTGSHFDRNIIVANLISQLGSYLGKFLESGFGVFSDEWQDYDYLKGKAIKVSRPTGVITGIACGVNEQGQLCLRDEQGRMHYLSSGDTSLRP